MFRIIFLLLLSINAYALDGIEYLGATKYPEIVVETHPKGLACGFLYSVDGFGSAHKVIDDLLATRKCTTTRIHLSWKDSHSFNDADIAIAVKKAKKLNNLVKKYPTVDFYVSPWLEHRANLALITKLQKEVSKVLEPRVKYTNSFISGGAYLPNVVNEVHHSLSSVKGKYIHSFDGLDGLDVDMNKYKDIHKKADIFFHWAWFSNSKVSKKDTTKRADRKLKPQKRMLQVQELQLANRYPPKHKLENGRIYKAYAEAHLDPKGQADSRSYSITFLTTGKPKEILFKAKGKVLLRLTFSGSTHGSQRIYRNISNPFAVDLWRDALKLNKKGMVNVWEDKVRVGNVLPIFRCGEYRNID